MEKSSYPNPSGWVPQSEPQFQPGPPTYDQATCSNSNSNTHMGAPMPMPQPAYNPSMPPPSLQQHVAAGLHPGQPVQPRQVVIIQSAIQPVGPDPTCVTCPYCHQQNITRVDYVAGTKTHLFAVLMCVFGLFFCACLPYCMNSCKNANHYCKRCGKYIGTYNGGSM